VFIGNAEIDNAGGSPITVKRYIGGLILWIPSSMMSVIAALIAMRNWLVLDARQHRAKTSVPAPTTTLEV